MNLLREFAALASRHTLDRINHDYSFKFGGIKSIGVVSAANDSRLYVTNYGDNAVLVITLSLDL